jgi:hypothetical protein
MDPAVTALRSALDCLLPSLPETRAVSILRVAIRSAVEPAEPANRPLISRSPVIDTAADLAAWQQLKQDLRASGVGLAEIARQNGIPRSSINQLLTPGAKRAPGRATFDLLRGWLAERGENSPAPAAAPALCDGDINSPAEPPAAARHLSHDGTNVPAAAPAAAAGLRHLTHDGSNVPHPGRLSVELRSKLAPYLHLTAGEIRNRFRMTKELLDRAAAGAEIEAAAIERIEAGLAGGRGNGATPAG